MKKEPVKALEIDNNPLLLSEFDKQQYQTLIKVVEKYNRLSTRVINTEKYPEYGKRSKNVSTYRSKKLLEWINSKTPLLNNNCEFEYSLNTKIHWIFNGMTSFPICPLCGKTFGIKKNISTKRGYHKFCSIQCVNKSEDTRNKIKQTNKLRYGDSNYNNRELSKQTTYEHYGVDNIFKAKEFIDKQRIILHENKDERIKHFKENFLKNHGVSHPMHIKEIKDKVFSSSRKISHQPFKPNRYEIDGVRLDSSYELIYFVWLRDNGYQFIYHPKIHFKYYDKGGYLHYYYPDFLVNDQIIEIKPAKCFDKNGNYKSIWKKKTKNIENNVDFYKGECMKQNGITIITEYELEECFEYVNEKYGLDFVKEHKLKRRNTV